MTTLLDDSIRSEVTDSLDEIHQQTGDSHYQVFTDWITLTLAGFTGDKEAYQKPIERHANDGRDEDTIREILKLHTKALAGLTLAMEETEEDVLGGVYEYYGLTSENFGQYFTPGVVSRGMAGMNLPDGDEIRDATTEDPLVIGDVSGCGSGRLIVDSARQLREIKPDTPAIFLGYDKDPLCAKMAVINFVLNGITGYVLLGDALKLDPHRVWFVSPGALLEGERPVTELSETERERVLARFFGVPADQLDTLSTPKETDNGEVDESSSEDPDPTPSPTPISDEQPTPEPTAALDIDAGDTSQVGFDEFA